MEMWRTRSTLVLLSAVAVLVVSGQSPVILDETPRSKVIIPYGSSVTFHCNVKFENPEKFWVAWYLNQSGPSFSEECRLPDEISNKSAKDTNVVTRKAKPRTEEMLKRTIINATHENSGWYFCKITIDIPFLSHSPSNGREVVITKSKEHTTYPSLTTVTGQQATVSPTDNPLLMNWWMWIIVGVSATILLLLLLLCVLVRRRRRRNREEDPIYANTRPVAYKSSPRPGTDNLKMASSSQNLRNPSPGGRRYEESKRRYQQ